MTDKDAGSPKRISLSELQEVNLAGIAFIIGEIEWLLGPPGTEDGNVLHTLRHLVRYLADRSKAVSMLVNWGYAWDAEIVLRSFYETAAKIAFLCLSEPSQREALAAEFWQDFEDIHGRRTARKAEFAQNMFEGKNEFSAAIFAALQEPGFFERNDNRSKQDRKAIEQRWSFSEIIESLSKQGPDTGPMRDIKSLLHIYDVASHLIHADKTAMELMVDRRLRPASELRLLEATHSGRILSDQISLWLFCADVIRRHLNKAFRDPEAVLEHFNRLHELGRPFATMFEDSQREFYERTGRLKPRTDTSD